MRQPAIFYERAYQGDIYAPPTAPEDHAFYPALKEFVERYQLSDKACLEVGAGRGAFQDLVHRYVGIDIALSAARFITAPFAGASATALPFRTASFEGVWSITVLEHIPGPEKVLSEMWRVLRPGGYLFLAPAWQCRPWAADGYQVRPFSDFDWKGKLIKRSIPVRDSAIYRSLRIFPLRLWRLLTYARKRGPTAFHYGQLEANFDKFWMADSDAVNSMDPFEVYLWYISRGARCLNYSSLKRAFFVRTGPLIFQRATP